MEELAVVYSTTFLKNNSDYYCNGSFGVFIDELAKYYNKIYLMVPVKHVNNTQQNYKIKSKNIEIQELPYFSSYISAQKKRKEISKVIDIHSEKWKCGIYLRHPNPITPLIRIRANQLNLPLYLHIVGDTTTIIKNGSKYRGIVKWTALLYAFFQDYNLKKMVKSTPTLVNGSGLRRLYDIKNDNVKEIRTSTFREKDIVSYQPRNLGNHITLLFVGYLRHEKGLEYLIEAVSVLNKTNNVYLNIIGDGPEFNNLSEMVLEYNLCRKINFLGEKVLGEELYEEYINSDIFILPSISEGTPRVLLESMAFGTPVIASNVGGVPFTVKNRYNGLLIDPRSSEEIVRAVRELITDNNLRENIIKNGLIYAKDNTLEKHVYEVWSYLNKF